MCGWHKRKQIESIIAAVASCTKATASSAATAIELQKNNNKKKIEEKSQNLETRCSNHLDGLSAKNGKNDGNE